MARSRLEKIGTIMDRVNGLLQSGAMKIEEKPLWYDIYQSFPPTREPRYDRPAPNITLRNIFYTEDIIRAKFHKEYKALGRIDLANHGSQTVTRRFINIYEKLRNEQKDSSEDDIFKEAIEALKTERAATRHKVSEEKDSQTTITDSFKAAKNAPPMKADIKDIFNE